MLCSLIYMSLVFAIYLSATSTGLNVMTQIFEQKGYDYLGNISIFTIFLFGMIGNFVCILYIRKLQYRHSFFIHSLGYLLFLISGLLVCHCADKEGGMCNSFWIYLITIISSAISGFTSSGLFITQNDYVAQLSKQSKKAGLYYGIAWAVLQISQVIGSLYSAFIIVQIKQFYFYCLMVAVATFGSLSFLFVSQPKQYTQSIVQLQEDDKEISNNEEMNKLNPISVILTMKEFRVKCFIFPMMITGCLLSFQWNVMHYIIENSIDTQLLSDEEITKYTLLVMTVLGCCEVLGGIFIGVFNTYTPKYTSQLLQFHLISIALLLAIINTYEQKYGICFLIAILWGLVDCGTTSTLLAIIAQDWNDQIQYFGLFNFLQCCGGMISTIISIILSQQPIEWSIFFLLICVCVSKFSISCYQKLYIKQ
ncbi:unnamed protein product [Paramecium primaurelia]|uniref:Major facilitator superfamily protein n=1 Tax=Paramecium primaurelia TaxID=5886 RepID=A0A8S1P916_PARPR|nr:unnamed protein product [Paramecium primaurelia]